MNAATEHARLMFSHLPEMWVLGLVLGPAVLILGWWAYHRPRRPLNRLLRILRLALLALAIFLALGPFLRRSKVHEEPAPLALLLDDSASLQRHDSLPPEAVARLAKLGLTPANGSPTRLELEQALLQSPWRSTLESRYRLEAWRFAKRLAPTAPDGSELTGQGTATAIGDALLGILAEHRGQRQPGIVLISDGRNIGGGDPGDAARRLAAEGVRVDVVALGDSRPAPDLALERIQSPDLVLAGDEALFLLRLRATGEPLPARATVRLEDAEGQLLDQTEVDLAGPEGTQFALSTVLRDPGEAHLVARVDPAPGEHALDDNRLDLSLEVEEARIRVLYVEGRPRYEYRYLKNRLLRADLSTRDLETRCWLADASRNFHQEASRGVPRLTRLPTTVEELLADFDVVILGDIDPPQLAPDPQDGSRFLEAVAAFVQHGGGLLVLAGPRWSPSYLEGTPLEAMLPVSPGDLAPRTDGPFQALPADLELPPAVTRLDRDPRANAAIWKALPALLWVRPVENLRPGAQTWLVARTPDGEDLILAAGVFVPEGRCAWLGTDETWRWRDPAGERFLSVYWRAMLRYLAAGRLRGDQGEVRLDLDRSRVELGQSVLVEARFLGDGHAELAAAPKLRVAIEDSEEGVRLAALPTQPGHFRGRFRPSAPGRYNLLLTADGSAEGEVLAAARLRVTPPSAEMRLTSQDRDDLTRIAALTGGVVVDLDRADELLARLDGRERLTRTLASSDQGLDGTPVLILFLLLAAGEWLLRKRSNLS